MEEKSGNRGLSLNSPPPLTPLVRPPLVRGWVAAVLLGCLMFSVASASIAGVISTCPVDTIPIQIVGGERGDPVTTLSAARLPSDPRFSAFVRAVTEHVAARLDKDKLCMDSAESKDRSLLQFVNWSIANWKNEGPVPKSLLDAQPASVCRITSPWIDLAIARKPVPSIRGVVRWNARQQLADQAVLAGASNVPSGVAMPLMSKEFTDFANDYVGSEIFREPAAKPIEERVPADILWLFRHSPQATFMPFQSIARNATATAMKKNAEGYTKLVIALIDHCFDAGGADIHYGNILDTADLIPLEQYKIDSKIILY